MLNTVQVLNTVAQPHAEALLAQHPVERCTARSGGPHFAHKHSHAALTLRLSVTS